MVVSAAGLYADRSRLAPSVAPPVRRIREVSPLSIARLDGGSFVVDFGDTKESISSAFSQLVGSAAVDISNTLSIIFFVASVAAYIGFLIQLIIGQEGRLERKSGQRQTISDPLGWAPGPPSPPNWEGRR